jgi:hypothetical protein
MLRMQIAHVASAAFRLARKVVRRRQRPLRGEQREQPARAVGEARTSARVA